METTTETTIKGKEMILDNELVVRTQVELERFNESAQLNLYVFLSETRRVKVDYLFVGRFNTWNENLEFALDKAKTDWKMEVELKEVA